MSVVKEAIEKAEEAIFAEMQQCGADGDPSISRMRRRITRAAILAFLTHLDETGPSEGMTEAGLDAIYHPGEMRDYARESFHAIISAALSALIKEIE
jgi:hypothetical protein